MLKLICLIVSFTVILLVMLGQIIVEPTLMPMIMFGALTSAIILSISRI